jgi:stage V sporulation protein R
MQLIDQHTKKIMEGCKERALDAGLKFDKESLEYIVTNADMLELSPKHMIPTLYDYWLHDIQVLRSKGEYEYYPHNPYETVINTRPAISFYNDNNPDWLNVMIFYHVLAHIDFFQNNKFYEKTWDYDFKEKALTEKRIIDKLRSKKGRWIDYVLEFSRGIDNLVGYFQNLSENENSQVFNLPLKVDFYFNVFLQEIKKVRMNKFLEEVERYNQSESSNGQSKEDIFFENVLISYPEFEEMFSRHNKKEDKKENEDLMQYLINESKFLDKKENEWMKVVIDIVRDTSLYFSPQIRTKTMNEGWASYWHEKLFMSDDRIKGHEISFAKVNAKVTSLNRVGLNPYAIGWRLFMFIEESQNKGKYTYEFNKISNVDERKDFNKSTNSGRDFIFHVRENYNDLTFFNSFLNQDFVDKHKLMVVGQRINQQKMVKEYYVKSRKAEDYKKMIINGLYHPPYIKVRNVADTLYLEHVFEGKELYRDYIPNTLIGIEYLWGNKVQLETHEIDLEKMRTQENGKAVEPVFRKVLYTVFNKKVTKQVLN